MPKRRLTLISLRDLRFVNDNSLPQEPVQPDNHNITIKQLIKQGGLEAPKQEEIVNRTIGKQVAKRPVPPMMLPPVMDWRKVNGHDWCKPPQHQGECNACVAFALCGLLEASKRIQQRNHNYKIDLSEAFIHFCRKVSIPGKEWWASCQDGYGINGALERILLQGGVPHEPCSPWNGKRCQADDLCPESNPNTYWRNHALKISGYEAHATSTQRKIALLQGPVAASMRVCKDFLNWRGNKVYKKHTHSQKYFHVVQVVGYDDFIKCWIIRNSYGPGWGDKGYGYIAYGQKELWIDSEDWPFYSVTLA